MPIASFFPTSWPSLIFTFLFFKTIYNCSPIHITYNFWSFPFLSVQFSSSEYIHTSVQPLPPSISRTIYLIKLKLYSLNNNSLFSLPFSPGKLPFYFLSFWQRKNKWAPGTPNLAWGWGFPEPSHLRGLSETLYLIMSLSCLKTLFFFCLFFPPIHQIT